VLTFVLRLSERGGSNYSAINCTTGGTASMGSIVQCWKGLYYGNNLQRDYGSRGSLAFIGNAGSSDNYLRAAGSVDYLKAFTFTVSGGIGTLSTTGKEGNHQFSLLGAPSSISWSGASFGTTELDWASDTDECGRVNYNEMGLAMSNPPRNPPARRSSSKATLR
jgi:hypothetical protein